MDLYPHNQSAYERVMAHFEAGNKRAAVVHATGTGKSYIIAAVAQHHLRTLVIAPREFILGEIRMACGSIFPIYDGCHRVTFVTYSALLHTEEFRKDYDLIVLDEFHHTGASEWGRKVQELLDVNPEARILGTSATPMRHSDHQRNMVDELFDGTIVSHLPLEDAIGKILPVPVYVRSIWDFDESERIIVESLLASRRTDEWKHEKVDLVKRQCLDWKKSKGVPQILAKYLKPEMRHVILFTPSVAEGRRLQAMLTLWMHKAGFQDIAFFEINSKVPGAGKVLTNYKEDNGHSIHIAIAINMLNEGVHIPGVDCIIMLRNTRSQTIIEQQLGRVLTASSQKQPLVLDFVNNISLVYSHKRIRKNTKEADNFDEQTPLFDSESTVRYVTPKLPFKIIDECKELDKLIKSISYNMDGYTIDELKEIAMRYKTRTEWKKSDDHKSYVWASKNGVIAEVSEHMGSMRTKRDSLTREMCMAEARKYPSREAFSKGSPSHYSRCLRMRWSLDEVLPPAHNTYTKEQCKELCKEYDGVKDIVNRNNRLYYYISQHGWLKECFPDSKISRYTKEMIKEITTKCKSRIEFKNKHKGAYAAAIKNGWLDEVLAHLPSASAAKNITREQFLAAAVQCKTRGELWERFPLECKYAMKNGWMTEDVLPSKMVRDERTDEQVVEDCRRYENANLLRRTDKRTYDQARRRNLLNVAFPDYQKKLHRMTLEVMMERVSQYDTYTDFFKNEPTSYQTCARRKWLPLIKAYFEKRSSTDSSSVI